MYFSRKSILSYINLTESSLICLKIYFNFKFDPYLIFAFGTILCLFILIFSYCRMCLEIRKLSNRSYRMTGHTISQRKALITTFFIVFSFLLCWLPASLWHTVASFRDGPVFFDSRISVKTVLFLLQSVNKIIDPILSAFRLPEVRCCYHKKR